MISATCQGCKKQVWLAENERNGKTSEHYYSPVTVQRLVAHNGGKARAIDIVGLYHVHRCGKANHFVHARVKLTTQESRRGVRTARERRAQARRKIAVSSGRE